MDQCPCESGKQYEACCGPLISGAQAAATAAALMRSRYTAFVKGEIGYLEHTLHPDHRSDYDPQATRHWADSSQWKKLEIVSVQRGGISDDEGTVEFIATYRQKGITHTHYEVGNFNRQNGIWYYTDGKMVSPGTICNEGPKTGRNDPCPCGSGRKYKKCCG